MKCLEATKIQMLERNTPERDRLIPFINFVDNFRMHKDMAALKPLEHSHADFCSSSQSTPFEALIIVSAIAPNPGGYNFFIYG